MSQIVLTHNRFTFLCQQKLTRMLGLGTVSVLWMLGFGGMLPAGANPSGLPVRYIEQRVAQQYDRPLPSTANGSSQFPLSSATPVTTWQQHIQSRQVQSGGSIPGFNPTAGQLPYYAPSSAVLPLPTATIVPYQATVSPLQPNGQSPYVPTSQAPLVLVLPTAGQSPYVPTSQAPLVLVLPTAGQSPYIPTSQAPSVLVLPAAGQLPYVPTNQATQVPSAPVLPTSGQLPYVLTTQTPLPVPSTPLPLSAASNTALSLPAPIVEPYQPTGPSPATTGQLPYLPSNQTSAIGGGVTAEQLPYLPSNQIPQPVPSSRPTLSWSAPTTAPYQATASFPATAGQPLYLPSSQTSVIVLPTTAGQPPYVQPNQTVLPAATSSPVPSLPNVATAPYQPAASALPSTGQLPYLPSGQAPLPNAPSPATPLPLPNNSFNQPTLSSPAAGQPYLQPNQTPPLPNAPSPAAPLPVPSDSRNQQTTPPAQAPTVSPSRPVSASTLQLQGVYLYQDDESSARARVGVLYPLAPRVLFGATVDLTEGNAFADSQTEGLNLNELYLTTSLADLPNLRFSVGQLDLTSYFDRNSFAKDGASQFFNLAFQTNPALSATGIGSRPGVLLNWNVTDNIEAKAAAFSSSRSLSDFTIDGAAVELGIRQGNAIIRGTYAFDRDAGINDSFPEVFQVDRGDGTSGIEEGDREEAYGVNAEVFIPNWNLGLFARYGKYNNREINEGADTYSFGATLLDLFTPNDRLGIAYGRGLSNDKLRRASGNETPDVLEVYYDFRFLPHLRLGFSLQERNDFSETVFGIRVKTDFDVSPIDKLL